MVDILSYDLTERLEVLEVGPRNSSPAESEMDNIEVVFSHKSL